MTLRSVVEEFMAFVDKYKVIGLAIGFMIASATTKFVTAMVTDLIMPLVSVALPGGDWRKTVFEVGPVKILIGDFSGALIDFLILVLVVFLIVKFVMHEDAKDEKKDAKAGEKDKKPVEKGKK